MAEIKYHPHIVELVKSTFFLRPWCVEIQMVHDAIILSDSKVNPMMKFSTMTLSGTPILQPITLAREEAFPARHFDIITDERRYRTDQTGRLRHYPKVVRTSLWN